MKKLIITVENEEETDQDGTYELDLSKPISIYSYKYTTHVSGIKFGTENERIICSTDGGYRSELSGEMKDD